MNSLLHWLSKFKHKNNYPVSFFITPRIKSKTENKYEGQTFAGVKQNTTFNKICLLNSKNTCLIKRELFQIISDFCDCKK